MNDDVAVFFDLGDTLVSPVVEDGHLVRLEVYPFVPEVLNRLRRTGGEAGVRIGLISNTGAASKKLLDDLLTECGLSALVDVTLCFYSSVEGIDKSNPALFERAAARAGLQPDHCWYVGEDAAERRVAAAVGFRVSPQPLQALQIISTSLARRHPATPAHPRQQGVHHAH